MRQEQERERREGEQQEREREKEPSLNPALKCETCSNEFPQNANFCPNCGARRVTSAAPSTPAEDHNTTESSDRGDLWIAAIGGTVLVYTLIGGLAFLTYSSLKEKPSTTRSFDTDESIGGEYQPAYSSYSSIDPSATLREIATRGKEKALLSPEVGDTFVDARVETIKTSSLTYPYAGRIIADYRDEDSEIDRCVVYFKYDGGKWIASKLGRGNGNAYQEPLTEGDALSPSPIEQWNTPSSASTDKVLVFLP